MSPTPGLLWVNSRISRPDILTDADFHTWYNSTHIPDIFKTSQMRSAFRYKSIDPSAKTPYLNIYPVPDAKWLDSEEFYSIPTKADCFKVPSRECFECVAFDTRYYEYVHGYEKEGGEVGPSTLIISAALTPAPGTDADFDAWYKEEHYRTLSECKGYVRTRRYKLRTALRNEVEVPTYLALHEFDVEELPADELARTAETPWAKNVMGSLAGSEVGVYRLLSAWGDVQAKF